MTKKPRILLNKQEELGRVWEAIQRLVKREAGM